MRTKLITAAAAVLAVATWAGTMPAAAQPGARIQSRGYVESSGSPCGFNSAVGCPGGYGYGYRGYRGYRGYGYRSYAFAPRFGRYRSYRYRRHY